nr:MAG: hypothetical protein [Microviridae sp.]
MKSERSEQKKLDTEILKIIIDYLDGYIDHNEMLTLLGEYHKDGIVAIQQNLFKQVCLTMEEIRKTLTHNPEELII